MAYEFMTQAGAHGYRDVLDDSAEFTIAASLRAWPQVVEGQPDPIKGLMARRLTPTGNLAQVPDTPRAAVTMVDCATQIDII